MSTETPSASAGPAPAPVTVAVYAPPDARADADAPDVHVFTEPAACLVGRGADCDIRIDAADRRVSRRHLLLDIAPPQVRLRDLGSRNGTYVNGRRLVGDPPVRELADGDDIRIGDTRLRVALPAAPERERARYPGHRLLHELGRGGHGVVHLARHEASGDLVALKTLLTHDDLDEGAHQGFLRELGCLGALHHRNIVRFREQGTATHRTGGRSPFFTSEYCTGGSIADLVARSGGRLPADRAVNLTLQTLDGLAHAHAATLPALRADGRTVTATGLVHRDITPRNLLLTSDGPSGPIAPHASPPTVKIADFGLAKALDTAGLSGHTRTGAMGGSIAFMPRSQVIDFKYAGPEVDLWATTACLYWMLTGEPPRTFLPGTDPLATVLREPPVPLLDRTPDLPAPLADLIDRVLAEPADGTAPAHTAHELAEALRERHPVQTSDIRAARAVHTVHAVRAIHAVHAVVPGEQQGTDPTPPPPPPPPVHGEGPQA
ncbi:protein kinase domain-containing protein [Streptomyces sp. NPDC002446]